MVLLLLIFAVTFSGLVLTSPTMHDDQPETQARVVRFENKSHRPRTYSVDRFADTNFSNGIILSESGSISNDQVQDIVGSYMFMGPDNVTHVINYYVDEDGFHPQGAPTGVNIGVLKSAIG